MPPSQATSARAASRRATGHRTAPTCRLEGQRLQQRQVQGQEEQQVQGACMLPPQGALQQQVCPRLQPLLQPALSQQASEACQALQQLECRHLSQQEQDQEEQEQEESLSKA